MPEQADNIPNLAHHFLKAWQQSILYQQEIIPLLAETLGASPLEIFYRWNSAPRCQQWGMIKNTQWEYFFHGYAHCDLTHLPDGRYLQITFGPGGRFDVFSGWATLQFVMAAKAPWPDYAELKEFLAKKPPPYTHLSGSHDGASLLSDHLTSLGYFRPAAPELCALKEQYTTVDEKGSTMTSLPEEFNDFTQPLFWDIMVCHALVLSELGQKALSHL